jgi:hypothetical protein
VRVRHGPLTEIAMSASSKLVLITAAAVSFGMLSDARADDAAASALFDQGKALFAAGRYGEARDKLEASYELSPLSGTAGLLAACHERTGQLASAWARYRDSAVLAERSGNEERAAIARAKVAELEPRLARLRIDRPASARAGLALVVTRNGARVPTAALGTHVPVDAGDQVLVATAPGHRSWTATIAIADGQRRTVSIPELTPEPEAADPEITVHRPSATDSPGRTRAWIGLGLLGAGGAAVVVGGGFAISASSAWSDAKDAGCSGEGTCPDEESRDQARSAGRRADLATGLVAAGLAVAATGLVIYWTAPDGLEEGRPSASVSARGDGDRFTIALEGRF